MLAKARGLQPELGDLLNLYFDSVLFIKKLFLHEYFLSTVT